MSYSFLCYDDFIVSNLIIPRNIIVILDECLGRMSWSMDGAMDDEILICFTV